MNILDQGKYASHHSIAYNEAYHPHYRLIEKTIFEKELLPLIEFDIYLMIGQSNCAGRGYKTKISNKMTKVIAINGKNIID